MTTSSSIRTDLARAWVESPLQMVSALEASAARFTQMLLGRESGWNGGAEPTVHLALNVPLPDPAVPFATTVEA